MRGADKEMLARWQEETTDQKRNNTDRVVAGTGQPGVELELDTKIESRKKEKNNNNIWVGQSREVARWAGLNQHWAGWRKRA